MSECQQNYFIALNSTALYCVAVAVFCMFGRTDPIPLLDRTHEEGEDPAALRRSRRYGAPVRDDGDVAAAHLLQSESESELELQ